MSGRSDPESTTRCAPCASGAVAITVLALAPGGPGIPRGPRRERRSTSTSGPRKAPAWQNGNLNGNNTRYPEGGIVPFRLAIEG